MRPRKTITKKYSFLLRPWRAAALNFALGFLIVSVPTHAEPPSAHFSMFSTDEISLYDLLPKTTNGKVIEKPLEVTSPSGKQKFIFPNGWPDDRYTFFAINGKVRRPIVADVFVNPYLMWSPYSPAAFVVYSDSGAMGGYHTLLITFDKGAVQVAEPTRQIGREFFDYFEKLGLTCIGGRESDKKFGIDINFYPIRWFDSSHALFAAEIVGHSICDCYGSFRGYKIELPSGKVVQAFDQARVKKEFGSNLGRSLVMAPNNNWDRDPKSCEPRGQ